MEFLSSIIEVEPTKIFQEVSCTYRKKDFEEDPKHNPQSDENDEVICIPSGSSIPKSESSGSSERLRNPYDTEEDSNDCLVSVDTNGESDDEDDRILHFPPPEQKMYSEPEPPEHWLDPGVSRRELILRTSQKRQRQLPYFVGVPEMRFEKTFKFPCTNRDCSLRCTEEFSEKERAEIFQYFWSLNEEQQGSFYTEFVEQLPIKKRKILNSRRNATYKYSLEGAASIRKTVCKNFFLNTLDFPESQPAIDDLKVCFEKVDLRPHLVQTLKLALETRLLHPGVDTSDILTGYVSAIKAIRHLDSTGVLLETITEPVKEYLRSRNDTVRCVVTGLIEDGPTDLAEELAKSEALKEEGVAVVDDLTNWESWNPDPVDANPSKVKPHRSADIISMVVDIYGSKELFVNEYKNLLAERLLQQLDLNSEKEIRNLELLKLRFGESVLHSCEVMLKDISDSKRINAHIQSDSNYSDTKAFEFSSLILSAQFWPGFKKEDLELPEAIQSQFENYRKSYEAYKGNRTLHWRPVSGKVMLEVEHMGKCVEYSVTPTQATIIYHFQEKSEWNLNDLSSIMKIPPSVLRRKITYWQSHGLIKETKTGSFILVEDTSDSDMEEMQTEPQDICDDDEESENVVASASDQREEELQVFWSYIVGMLTNLDSLPIERIHQMLKMFASNEKGVEFSLDELKDFLQTKVREHQLIFASGVYHLPK
uniref:Anaphase-promoting complex subunit 2 n=1 Tax=Phlebotomus papatasi TaxID=29031 RepID=A0A1B0D9E0_PHLPP